MQPRYHAYDVSWKQMCLGFGGTVPSHGGAPFHRLPRSPTVHHPNPRLCAAVLAGLGHELGVGAIFTLAVTFLANDAFRLK